VSNLIENGELFPRNKQSFSLYSRSYQGRICAPRKSTPSVSIAKASGVSFQLWTLCLTRLRPAEGTLFQPFAQHPQTCPIKIKHFDPGMSPITKDVERSAARVLSKTAAHQPVQTVEALAHVAAVDQQKDLQAPTEADHRFAPSRPSNSAANAASAALLI